MEHVEDLHHLPHRIGRPGLLPIPEGGVGDEHVLRGVGHNELVIKVDTGNLAIREDVPHQVGFVHLHQPILPEMRVLVIQ